jgi:hypothetical protein
VQLWILSRLACRAPFSTSSTFARVAPCQRIGSSPAADGPTSAFPSLNVPP